MKIINIENFNEFINIIEDNTIDYIIINISAMLKVNLVI